MSEWFVFASHRELADCVKLTSDGIFVSATEKIQLPEFSVLRQSRVPMHSLVAVYDEQVRIR